MSQTIELILEEDGRIRVPASLRAQLRLTPGTTLVVEEGEQGDARLNVQLGPILVDEGGILVVATPPLDEDFDIVGFVQREREERIQEFIRQAGL